MNIKCTHKIAEKIAYYKYKIPYLHVYAHVNTFGSHICTNANKYVHTMHT